MELPDDIWTCIYPFLHVTELCKLRQVCKTIQSCIDTSKTIWTTNLCTTSYGLSIVNKRTIGWDMLLTQITESQIYDPMTGMGSKLAQSPPFYIKMGSPNLLCSDTCWSHLKRLNLFVGKEFCLHLGQIISQAKCVYEVITQCNLTCNSEGESLEYRPFLILDESKDVTIADQLIKNFGLPKWVNAITFDFLNKEANGIPCFSLEEGDCSEDVEISESKVDAWNEINEIWNFKKSDRVDGVALGYQDSANPIIVNCGRKDGFIYGVLSCTVMT